MITVKNINGFPEYTPKNILGSHCDGDNFYFFENQDEVESNKIKSESEGVETIIDDRIDLIKILSKASKEEIDFIKNILK